MAPFIDARIKLIFGRPQDAGVGDALLLEGEGPMSPGSEWFLPEQEAAHPVGCACCQARSNAGMALARLMLARGRGAGPFFSRVIVVAATDAGRRAVRHALVSDPIASAYFKGGDQEPA
jgi:hypothetical protein